MTIQDTEVASLFRAHRLPGPAYRRLKDLIVEQIGTGRWTEGQQLPAETQLASSLGLSRMTVNRALRELTAEGLVVRTAGVGSFVAKPKASSALFEVHSIADEVVARGHRHRADVLTLAAESADPRAAVDLDVPEGARVFHSVLVHYEDDRAIQLEDRLVVPAQAPDYLAQDFTHRTPHAYLMDIAPLMRGEHVVEAVVPGAEERRLLQLDEHEAGLLIRRRTWSHDRVVSAARLLHPGTRYRLEGVFDA
ncbi:histidine utilization repressor [Tsukamurella sp. 1534]|uniref:histidine utilization repressor n=1 Tax=Tsukamurella sp. 1534 TaxID=1151061 RepID=UPI0003077D38|nr:histidine utilization repressor [Tsukamurella sp. 1534]